MSDYGVTEKGFVLKRMDTILEEIHAELSEGFGFDTRLSGTSFLGTLVTTFAGQIADLWESAQDSYYAKYPTTATGLNLDHAVQYGGIHRIPDRRTCYSLHCTGKDGATVRAGVYVATDTKPEVRLYSAEPFKITRENCNAAKIRVASAESGASYSLSVNGKLYAYTGREGSRTEILQGLRDAALEGGLGHDYEISLDERNGTLEIRDTIPTRSNFIVLSDNLTTQQVTTIASFLTEVYGKITLPNGIVTVMVNNIAGFEEVTNRIAPVYGRLQETDVELRQSYIAKSALRSNTMIDSIVAELLNNVPDIESASGYENDTDYTNSDGMPPHSIELVVEGGNDSEIAEAILKRKAGGIQTCGKVEVNVPGRYGEAVPVRFNRPRYLYTWLKVVLHGKEAELPVNYRNLVTASIGAFGDRMRAGDPLLIQLLNEGIYDDVSGVTYIDILTAYSEEPGYTAVPEDYQERNVPVTMRQKVLIDRSRIEVVFHDSNS